MQRPPSEERGPLHGQSRQGRAEDRSAMPSVCSGRPKIAVQSRALAVRLPVRFLLAHGKRTERTEGDAVSGKSDDRAAIQHPTPPPSTSLRPSRGAPIEVPVMSEAGNHPDSPRSLSPCRSDAEF